MTKLKQQLTLKPQDLVVILKLAQTQSLLTYASLGQSLLLAASEVHASVKRLIAARLVAAGTAREWNVMKGAIKDFVCYGARYAFPPISGTLARGLPTAYAYQSFRGHMVLPDEPPPVWPSSKGAIRGMTLYPLYPSVPLVAEKDEKLYEALALFDAIRIGGVREREFAIEELNRVLQ